MPADDNRHDDLPDWLRDSGTDPVELDLPVDDDEFDDIDDDAVTIVHSGVSVPRVSSVWVATEEQPRTPIAPSPVANRDTRRPASLMIAGLLAALIVIVTIGLYVWQIW